MKDLFDFIHYNAQDVIVKLYDQDVAGRSCNIGSHPHFFLKVNNGYDSTPQVQNTLNKFGGLRKRGCLLKIDNLVDPVNINGIVHFIYQETNHLYFLNLAFSVYFNNRLRHLRSPLYLKLVNFSFEKTRELCEGCNC